MKVDLLIKDIKVYNSYLKKFSNADIAILNGKFLYIGKKDSHKFQPQDIIDGRNNHMIPGLIDIHMHIESSMATPYYFSEGVARRGVTTIVSEPHEIANVLGREGVIEMIKASEGCSIDIYYGVPSSVPSTNPQMETTGGLIEVPDVQELMKLERVKCLGEVMNYVDVIKDEDSKIRQIIDFTLKNHPEKLIEGHCPQLSGLDLAKFIYRGIDSDHTQQSVDGMLERVSNGMFIEIQEKSINKEIVDCIKDNNILEYISLTTDDVMANDFVEKGHMDHLVKKIIDAGLSLEEAIYIATYTPARRMRMYDRGVIAPGKIADFVIIKDIKTMDISKTYKAGKLIYNKDEEKKIKSNTYKFPKHFYETVKLKPLKKENFELKTIDKSLKEVSCRVIGVQDQTTYTKEIIKKLSVIDGKVVWEDSDNCLIGVFERYGKKDTSTLGLITGNTIKRGAVATTYAHDHHNLLVIGKNIDDMILAANSVIESQGGYCAVENGKILAKIDLPIGGILSELPMNELGTQLNKVVTAIRKLGYEHKNPIMSLSTNTLPVSPSIKITDIGLMDVKKGEVVSLFTS